MSPRVLVIQHVPQEHLGQFEIPLKEEGVEIKTLRIFESEAPAPDWEPLGSPQGLIVMGGPMSANDEPRLNYIARELRLIEQAIKRGCPVLGICLGSQLIAKALGARVYPGPEKEIGWYDLDLTPEGQSDPLFHGWPARLRIFQWHGETFDLPSGAVHLACSSRYPHQAFRFGENVYGLQFHPEITLKMITHWLNKDAAEVAAARLPHRPEAILTESRDQLALVEGLSQSLARSWAGLIS